MAITGTFYGATGNAWIKPRIDWTAVSNIEGNYSEVTATLYYIRTNSGYTTYGHWGGSLTINGDTKHASGIYLEINEYGYTAAITHTVRVNHDEDGSKTIIISAGGAIADTTLSYTAISAQVTLETIPRASSISATDADIGAVSMVSVGRRSDRYTHTVAYQFGSLQGYLTPNGLSEDAVKLTQVCLPFSLPESFYQQIPNAPTGVCMLTCTTYLEDTVIGSAQKTSFTVRANPEKCGPLLSAQAVDTNPATVALTGSSAKAVRYASNMYCTMTCQARDGAHIAEKKIADTVVTEDFFTITGLEYGSIRFSVRDSRGYTAQTILSPDFIAYSPPTGKLTVTRTDATSGKADLQVQGNWFSGSFGATENQLQLRYRINSGSWQTVSPSLDGDSYSASAHLTGLTYTSAHKIQLQVTDKLRTLELTTQVNPGIPVFDWGSGDFQFHVPVTAPKLTGLSDPAAGSDAANKTYADTKLSLTGGQMAGKLDMCGYLLTGLQEPGKSNDAVTKNYADGKLSMTLLWENASVNSRFPAQTLPLDLSEYDHVAIVARWVASYEWCNQEMKIFGKEQGSDGRILSFAGASTGIVSRFILSIDDTGITFSGGQHWSLSGSSLQENNSVAIPVNIYGVKGVGT